MERKIQWNGCLDEIDLVYDKAAEKEAAAKIISELEAGALAEAEANCGVLEINGRPITPEQYGEIHDSTKAELIASLGSAGLSYFGAPAPLTEPKIIIRLSPHIQSVRCSTAFSILNRLEKLDGAFNARHPKATLEIQVPLGGRQGLVQIEMLISMLYPWLSISEVSSNVAAAQRRQTQPTPQQKNAAPKAPAPLQTHSQNMPADKRPETRHGFWERLFGKKKKKAVTSPDTKKTSVRQEQKPDEKFFHEMEKYPAFRNAFSCAKAETIRAVRRLDSNAASEFEELSEIEQLQLILGGAGQNIVPSALLCIDGVEDIPYCLAITLLYMAYTGKMEKQLLDTGDGSDISIFKAAVASLRGCYPKWTCKILTE